MDGAGRRIGPLGATCRDASRALSGIETWPYCRRRVGWVQASGRGKLYSYTVARREQSPEFANDLPYIIAAITLEEGPRMTSLLVEADPDNVQIDGLVEVVWDDVSAELSLPFFRPAQS